MDIFEAIKNNDIIAIDDLLEKGVDINDDEKTRWGKFTGILNTPLMHAIDLGNINIVKHLIDKGADINQHLDKDGPCQSSLRSAIRKDNIDIATLLINNGFNLNDTDIFDLFIETHNAKIFDILFTECNKLSIEIDLNRLLFFKNHYNAPDMIKKLVACGADINTIEHKRTVLINAIEKNNIELLLTVIDLGADINLVVNNLTPLMTSVKLSNKQATEILINAGVYVDFRSAEGESALSIASEYENIIQLVLLKPELMSHADEDGITMLMTACQDKDEETILFLYEKGANFHFKNNEGKSALDILKRKKQLPDRLKSILEKLSLTSIVDDVEYNSLGL